MNYLNIILGNICSLLAMGSDSISSAQRSIKRVLWIQNLSQAIYCLGAVFLNAYSACAQNLVSILRNLVAICKISSKWLEWSLTILGVALGLAFNNRGWVGLLPVIANLQYTLVIFRYPDRQRALKISFLISVLSFAVFNIVLWNFVGVASDLFVSITTAIMLIRDKKSPPAEN